MDHVPEEARRVARAGYGGSSTPTHLPHTCAFSCDMRMVAAVTREMIHVAPLDDSHRVGSARPRRGTCHVDPRGHE